MQGLRRSIRPEGQPNPKAELDSPALPTGSPGRGRLGLIYTLALIYPQTSLYERLGSSPADCPPGHHVWGLTTAVYLAGAWIQGYATGLCWAKDLRGFTS